MVANVTPVGQRKKKGFSLSGGWPLGFQLTFTALAFLALNVLTYVIVRDIIYNNLSQNAENVLLITQTQVENDLNNPKMYLAGFSRTIRTSVMHSVDRTVLKNILLTLPAICFRTANSLSALKVFPVILKICREGLFS